LTFLPFFSRNLKFHLKDGKIILTGFYGIILLFLSGIIIIYVYSIQPVPERIIKGKNIMELPDLTQRSDLK
jgi:hypothetical protein